MTETVTEAMIEAARLEAEGWPQSLFRDPRFHENIYLAMSRASQPVEPIEECPSVFWTAEEDDAQPVDTGVEREPVCAMCNGTRDDLARGREPEELCDPCYEDATATITPPLDSEAVERAYREGWRDSENSSNGLACIQEDDGWRASQARAATKSGTRL